MKAYLEKSLTFLKNAKLTIAAIVLLLLVLPLTVIISQQKQNIKIQADAATNPISIENQQQGSTGWKKGAPGMLSADDISKQIKGYASAVSVNKGESITFHVSVNPVQTFTADIYRLGWYGGTGGRLMRHLPNLEGVNQPTCPMDQVTGMIACDWSDSYTFTVPTDWTSGVYVVHLLNSQNYENYIVFTVRDDSRIAPLLFQQAVNTYQAYNNYPDDHNTGKSLYDYNSFGEILAASGNTNAVKVSFDRPYAGSGVSWLFHWELDYIHWIEKEGYDVTYSTDVDTHANGAKLLDYKGFLSVGHDEYWSKPMYDAVQTARDNGVNLGFFGGNELYWQVRFEDGPTGTPNRVMVCYRNATRDPNEDPALETVQWRSAPVNRPEQSFTGLDYGSQISTAIPMRSYVVTNSNHWVYTGTGLKDGDSIPQIVGYEMDIQNPAYPLPDAQPGTYVLLSNSPYTDEGGNATHANSSIYQALSGAWVFNAGTIAWAYGLDRNADARLQTITKNILNTFVTNQLPTPPPPTPTPLPSAYRNAVMADSPLAYFKLDETAGASQITDSSGHNYTGTSTGGLTFAVTGALAEPANKAIQSNGTGKVTFPTLPSTTNFTIEGWSYLTDPAWNSNDFYKNTMIGTSGTMRMIIRPAGSVLNGSVGYFGVWLNGTEYALQPAIPTVNNINTWVYWTFVRNGSTLTLYRNGVQIGQRTDLPATALANINGLIFGAGSGSQTLQGKIDEIALYDKALSTTAIQNHYKTAITTTTPTPTPTAIPTPGPILTISMNPVADTYVQKAKPTTPAGASKELFTDGNPVSIAYLRFDLTPLAGKTIVNAKLTLRVANNASTETQTVKLVSNNTWNENTMTYNNRPAISSTVLATLNSQNLINTWFNLNLTSAVTSKAGQLLSIAFEQTSTDELNFLSRESSYKPLLSIQYR